MTTYFLNQTVSRLASELPGAAKIFRVSGFRLSDIGHINLSEAAVTAGIPPRRMSACLVSMAKSAVEKAPKSQSELPPFIIDRFHKKHREEIDWLSTEMERDHHLFECSSHLQTIIGDIQQTLLAHMDHEESCIFQVYDELPIQDKVSKVQEHQRLIDKLMGWQIALDRSAKKQSSADSMKSVIQTRMQNLLDETVVHFHLEAIYLNI